MKTSFDFDIDYNSPKANRFASFSSSHLIFKRFCSSEIILQFLSNIKFGVSKILPSIAFKGPGHAIPIPITFSSLKQTFDLT